MSAENTIGERTMLHHAGRTTVLCVGMLLALGCGRGSVSAPKATRLAKEDIQTVRLHFDGFTKSESGATWMAWPNKVKEALVELEGVSEIRMELERDDFIVQYDASRASLKDLIATSKSTGFPATVVEDTPSSETPAFFEKALARAKEERKLLVIDFTASWCPPCQRMLRETFPDPLVANVLGEGCVLVTVDTDEHPRLAREYSVVGLPDIRFLAPDGEELYRQRDFRDAEQFAAMLKRLLVQVERADNLVDVAGEEENVREIFNQDSEHVRLLLVLSPT